MFRFREGFTSKPIQGIKTAEVGCVLNRGGAVGCWRLSVRFWV